MKLKVFALSVTKSIFTLSLSLPLSLMLCHAALAKPATNIEQCEKLTEKNNELSFCLDKVKDLAERELKTWVNNQVFVLEDLIKTTGRGAALTVFKRSQKLFEEYREDNCRWQFLQLSPSSTAGTIYKKCYIEMTQARTNELAKLNK